MRRGPVFASVSRSGVRFRATLRQPFFLHRFHHRRFFFATVPWGYYYPGWYYGTYSYPLSGDAYSSYDSSREYYDQNRELVQEVSRLGDEVGRLREEQEARYANPPSPPVQPQAEAKPEAHPSTVLVFRDRRIQEVQNYAVVGPTLWIFGERRARKVPLADVDVPATTKLNDERGVEFRIPN